MPLPTPNTSETEADFISRCMGDETIRRDFPDQEQRVGVCYSQWRKKDEKSATALLAALQRAPESVKSRLAAIAEQEQALKVARQKIFSSLVPPDVEPRPRQEKDIVRNDCRILNRKPRPVHTPGQVTQVKALNSDTAEITIYSDIGADGMFGDAFGVADFSTLLEETKGARNIYLRINSLGGDVFEGIAIYNRIRGHSARFTAFVDGVAASIASVIAMAADEVVMYDNTAMMIHLPWTYAEGNAEKFEKVVKRLEGVRGQMLSAYMYKTGLPEDEILDLLRDETWFTAAEAVASGFADRIESGVGGTVSAQTDRDWIQHPAARDRLQAQRVSYQMAQAALRLDKLDARGLSV